MAGDLQLAEHPPELRQGRCLLTRGLLEGQLLLVRSRVPAPIATLLFFQAGDVLAARALAE